MSQAKHDSISINRRIAITGAAAAAAVPIAVLGSAAAGTALADPAPTAVAGKDFSAAGCLARAEQAIHDLRTRHICEGWHGHGLDEEAAARTLDYFRRGMAEEDDEAFHAAIKFFGEHGQSLDWIFMGDPGGMICQGAARSSLGA